MCKDQVKLEENECLIIMINSENKWIIQLIEILSWNRNQIRFGLLFVNQKIIYLRN